MTEQEIIITICLLSIGLILCFIAYLYFRKKYYSKSSELARSFQNDIDFKKRVEEFRKEIAIEYQDKFEKKYNIEYYDFGCTPPNEECVIQYNKTIFANLDKKYGRKWRKEVRKDVIGLK